MKFLEPYKRDYNVIFGIDASTHVIGIAVLDSGTPKFLSRINLTDKEVYRRLKDLRLRMEVLADLYHPEFVMVESPIMVQNPLTTKNISYVVGVILSAFLDRGIPIEEVSPITWKTWLGYKRILKRQKDELISRLGNTAGTKEINRLRKSQIQDILIERYAFLTNQLADDNLADALGIALFAQNRVEEKIKSERL